MTDILFEMIPLAQRGYCCSQILVSLALKAQGQENPQLLGAVAGLCHGIGVSGSLCGALTGGVCVLGMHAGKKSDHEPPDERLLLMASQLVEWFTQEVGGRFGGITCADILGLDNPGRPDPAKCARIVGDTFHKVVDILREHDFDLDA